MIDEMARIGEVRPEVNVGKPPRLPWDDLMGVSGATYPFTEQTPPHSHLRLTGSTHTPSRPPRRPALVWASAAAVAAIIIAGMTLGRGVLDGQAAGSRSTSAPSSVSASPTSLAGLADIAEQQTDVGTGETRYLKLSVWLRSGFMSADQAGSLTQVTSEIWSAPDGSGRVTNEPPDVQWDITPGDYPASEMPDWPECRAGTVTVEAPDDPAQAEQLGIQPLAAAWMLALSTCNQMAGPLPGHAQAALLRQLAASDGVEERGLMTDRLGRTGLAFAVARQIESGTDELEIVLDPNTGRLLASRITLTSANVSYSLPSVAQYVAIEQAAMVPSIGVRP